ncbi:MAG TPA: serine hydrolase domain-containing protein [Longimicrobium sp.]|jgi:CubicO group peptidase (beta-lactamase class C family)
MSHFRPSALLLAAIVAASLNACDGKAPTAPAPSIAAVKVTAVTTTFVPGQSTQLVASAAAAGGEAVSGAALTWLSEAPDVAAVDAAGRVTAVSAGTAVVAATAGTVRGTVTITVQEAPVGGVASLSSIVDSVRLALDMPAMGAAIVTLEGGIVAIGAAGTRRATGGAPVTTGDLWHLGSNTKALTSLLAAVAVSQNRIQWTTTIPQVFPELANIRAEYRDVTLRELLSHQSGLTTDLGQGGLGSGTTAVDQRAAFMAAVVQQPPSGTRGTYSYSNLGYVVAGAMLERVFATSFEAAMTAQVFAPLGMTDAGWGPQAAAGSTTQPVAHRWGTNGPWLVLEGFDIPPVFASSGTMHMSLASWGRLVREVLRVEAGTPTLASAAVAREITSEVIAMGPGASYGLGWGITTRSWAGGKVLIHDGSNTGNHSLAIVAPLRNVALLVTTNGYDPNGRSGQALGALQDRLITFHNTGK